MEKFLTLTEVARILGIKEDAVVKLADQGELTAYRIGGNFLRFKLRDIEEYRKKKFHAQTVFANGQTDAEKLKTNSTESPYQFRDKLYDFFYYHDFYIVIFLLIALLLIVIFKF
jgi:excisionase family DNA binding protein